MYTEQKLNINGRAAIFTHVNQTSQKIQGHLHSRDVGISIMKRRAPAEKVIKTDNNSVT